jgi:hypothetical protein
MKPISFVLCISLISVTLSLVQAKPCQIPDIVKEAFKCGNSKSLTNCCCENVDLSIPGNEGQFKKDKVEVLLKEFFLKNVPKVFSVVFEGHKEHTQYTVGKLITNNGIYRINLLFKDGAIQQLRIETYDED